MGSNSAQSLKFFSGLCTSSVTAALALMAVMTLLEFRTIPTFLEILISKSDLGPVNLPGL